MLWIPNILAGALPKAMSTNLVAGAGTNTQRYEVALRISEALSTCGPLEELPRLLAEHLSEAIPFEHLDILVFKENSSEIEWQAWGKGPVRVSDVPAEELAAWHVYDSQEPLFIPDWKTDERFPRLKQSVTGMGFDIGSVLRLPLATPHRRLGTLGIASRAGITYSMDDVDFMRRIARVVTSAVDNAVNLRKARQAQAQLQYQNDRLQLLMNLTNRITSNLEFRELLRSITATIREVMHFDFVDILLPDEEPGKLRIYAVDFPRGKGFVKEGLLISPRENDPARRALATLKPVIVDKADPNELPPEVYEMIVREGAKSHCVIPLVNRGRALGLLAIARMTEGSYTPEDIEFLSQVTGQIAIAVENALAYGEIRELKEQLAKEKVYLEDEIRSEMNFAQIIGKSPALRKVLQRVEIVAPTDSTVLIYGETGTGKELIARAIHDLSPRRAKPFVKLNCAAIPTGLLESELFGHEKGAFTGAIAQRIGRFEVANGGTIFLDEIGEIPLELQTKLLRVLQEREFERLGSSHTLRTDARLIAATNRDLEAMVSEQKFRSDLFFRINVFPLHVPPLRERPEDIPLLVRHFTQQLARRMQKAIDTIPSATMDALCRYHWPGNIRELQNVIERAVILSPGPKLDLDVADLKPSKASQVREEVVPPSSDRGGPLRRVMDETERQQILKALARCNWVVAGPRGAAALLGMKRSTLQLRMRKLGISRRPA
jgi:formate hydrogenlyase transcriptional activator